jgi:hypothetical protein
MVNHFHPSIEPALDLCKKLKINAGLKQLSEAELSKHRKSEIVRLKFSDFETLKKFNRHFYKQRFNNQQLVLNYIEKFINKVVALKDNKTWRKVVEQKTIWITVDADENTSIQYRLDWFTNFISAYAEYLKNDITVLVIEKYISELKSVKQIQFKGKIIEAAHIVVDMYAKNPDQYSSLTQAAKDFFDTHTFVIRKGKYKFETFMESVKKV